jgi:SRSO17 transposase
MFATNCVSTFYEIVLEFAPVFTAPSFENFCVIVLGWLLCQGRRTVTEVICAAGLNGVRHHSAFHRFFSRARWALDETGRVVALMAVALLAPDGPVLLAVDDTLCRKRGRKIFGVGMHHDPLLSSRKVSVMHSGHSWVVLALVVKLPFLRDVWVSLPVAFGLYRAKKTCPAEEYVTRPQIAVRLIERVASWFPERRLVVMGDAAYGGKSVVRHLPEGVDLIARMHPKARLNAPAPKGERRRGRPRIRGGRIASPQEQFANMRGFRRVKMALYGRKGEFLIKQVRGALWYNSAGARRVNIAMIRDASGKMKDDVFYTTDLSASAEEILKRYAMRWSIEVAFHDAKGCLGLEDPQNRTRKAVERSAPFALLVYSMAILWWCKHGHKTELSIFRPWYRQKRHVSFADMLGALRREILRERFLTTPPNERDSQKIIEHLVDRLSRVA